MKKVLALVMVALLALSLCACGELTVEEVLNGTVWEINVPISTNVVSTHWEFTDGRFYQEARLDGKKLGDGEEGSYIVNDDGTITIDWDDPDETDDLFYYIFENEQLTMSTLEDMSVKMERIK